MSYLQPSTQEIGQIVTLENAVSRLVTESARSQSTFCNIKQYVLKLLNGTPRKLPKETFAEVMRIIPPKVQINIFTGLSIERLLLISKSETPEFKQAAEEAILEQLNSYTPFILENEQEMLTLLSSALNIDIASNNCQIALLLLFKSYLTITNLQNNTQGASDLKNPLLTAKNFEQFLNILSSLSCFQIGKLSIFILQNDIDFKAECTETLINLFVQKYLSAELSTPVPTQQSLDMYVKLLLHYAIETENLEIINLILHLPFDYLSLCKELLCTDIKLTEKSIDIICHLLHFFFTQAFTDSEIEKEILDSLFPYCHSLISTCISAQNLDALQTFISIIPLEGINIEFTLQTLESSIEEMIRNNHSRELIVNTQKAIEIIKAAYNL